MGRPPLRAQDFMANNPEHLELLRRMGVSLIHLKDGRVQLVQHATQVTTAARMRRKRRILVKKYIKAKWLHAFFFFLVTPLHYITSY